MLANPKSKFQIDNFLKSDENLDVAEKKQKEVKFENIVNDKKKKSEKQIGILSKQARSIDKVKKR